MARLNGLGVAPFSAAFIDRAGREPRSQSLLPPTCLVLPQRPRTRRLKSKTGEPPLRELAGLVLPGYVRLRAASQRVTSQTETLSRCPSRSASIFRSRSRVTSGVGYSPLKHALQNLVILRFPTRAASFMASRSR